MATIRETLWELREQYRSEIDPDRRRQIEEQYDRALDAALELSAHDIGANSAEYETAAAALEEANVELRKTRDELQDFAETVMKVAKAVDMLVKVAKKVAGGV